MADRYVATTGNDTTGTGAFGAPYLTIKKAWSVAGAADNVIVLGGSYAENIGGATTMPSGTAGNPITIRPYSITGVPDLVTITGSGSSTIIDPAHGEAYISLTDLVFNATGVDFAIGGNTNPNHWILTRVEVKNATKSGILPHGTYWSLLQCHVHNNGSNNVGGVPQDHGVYYSGTNLLIDGGSYHDNWGYGIQAYDSGVTTNNNNVVRNAKIYSNGQGNHAGGTGGMILTSGDSLQAYNNRIYLNYGTGLSLSESGTSTNGVLYNNTLYGNTGYGILIGAASTGATVKNNICWSNGTDTPTNLGSGTTLSNNFTTDPTFTNSGSADFTLQAASLAIGAGLDLTSLGIAGLLTDAAGVPRPSGVAWDAGAFTYVVPLSGTLPIETFAYTSGTDLAGLNGGTSWSTAWANWSTPAMVVAAAPVGGGNAAKSVSAGGAYTAQYARTFAALSAAVARTFTVYMWCTVVNPSAGASYIGLKLGGADICVIKLTGGNWQMWDQGIAGYQTIGAAVPITYRDVCQADSPSAAWRLGEASGTVAADSSGNGLNGTYVGGPTLGVTGALAGDPDKAVTLDGSSQYVTVPDNGLLDPGDVLTLEIWVYPTSRPGDVYMFAKDSNGYAFGVNINGFLQFGKYGVSNIVLSTVAVSLNTWHHAVVTKNGAAVNLYLDGVDVTGVVTNATIAATASPLNIGRIQAAINYFPGSLDEARLYPTALSAARILAHYTAGITAGITATAYRIDINFDSVAQPNKYRARLNSGTYSSYYTVSGGSLTSVDTLYLLDTMADAHTTYWWSIGADASIISAVSAIAVTTISAWIIWTTSITADSQVQYGLTPTYGTTTTLDASLLTSHAVALTRLTPATTYHYRVLSRDGGGNLQTGDDHVFTTLPVQASSTFAPEHAAYARTPIYKVELAAPASTVSAAIPGVRNPVAYWPLNEASGTRVDMVGSNDLTPYGGVTQAVGKVSNAVHLTAASSQYLAVVDNPVVSTGDIDYTLACWVYADTLPGAGGVSAILSKYGGVDGREYLVSYNQPSGKFEYSLRDITGTEIGKVQQQTVSTATWYLLICWHDSVANLVGISINNAAATTSATTGEPSDTACDFSVGAYNVPIVGYWDGRICEVGFWKCVLTAAERTTLYNSGAGVTAVPLLIADYHFCTANPSSGEIIGDAILDPITLERRADVEHCRFQLSTLIFALNDIGAKPASPIPAVAFSLYRDVCQADNPVGAWRLGEASGTVAYDTSGHGLDGTYVGSPTLGVLGALAGDPDTAVTFNSALSQYATVPDNALLDPGDVFTLECWVKWTGLATTGALIDKGANGYALDLAAGAPRLIKQDVAYIVTATAAVPIGVWAHVAATKNGAAVKLYINGVDVTGVVTNATIAATAEVLHIGSYHAPTVLDHYFNGGLDEVRIYATALSAARVLAHTTAGITTAPNRIALAPVTGIATAAVASGLAGFSCAFWLSYREIPWDGNAVQLFGGIVTEITHEAGRYIVTARSPMAAANDALVFDGAQTQLAAAITDADTTLQVVDARAFVDPGGMYLGALLIDDEYLFPRNKSATTFTRVVRVGANLYSIPPFIANTQSVAHSVNAVVREMVSLGGATGTNSDTGTNDMHPVDLARIMLTGAGSIATSWVISPKSLLGTVIVLQDGAWTAAAVTLGAGLMYRFFDDQRTNCKAFIEDEFFRTFAAYPTEDVTGKLGIKMYQDRASAQIVDTITDDDILDYPQWLRNAELLINQVTYNYDYNPTAREFTSSYTYADKDLVAQRGRILELVIESKGIRGYHHQTVPVTLNWFSATAAFLQAAAQRHIARFGNKAPVISVQTTFQKQLLNVGDDVELTFSHAVNIGDGTIGLTHAPAEVTAMLMTFATGVITIECLLYPV